MFLLGMAAGIAVSLLLLWAIIDRGFNRLREAKTTREEQLESQLGIDTPWPVSSIIKELLFAAEVLLKDYNYDRQGYENIIAACDAARALPSPRIPVTLFTDFIDP